MVTAQRRVESSRLSAVTTVRMHIEEDGMSSYLTGERFLQSLNCVLCIEDGDIRELSDAERRGQAALLPARCRVL